MEKKECPQVKNINLENENACPIFFNKKLYLASLASLDDTGECNLIWFDFFTFLSGTAMRNLYAVISGTLWEFCLPDAFF